MPVREVIATADPRDLTSPLTPQNVLDTIEQVPQARDQAVALERGQPPAQLELGIGLRVQF